MKLHNLYEAQDILFHHTNLNNALNILEKGEFVLTPSVKTVELAINKKTGQSSAASSFFMSLTRSILGSYHTATRIGAFFVIDGKRLQQHGKIASVVYYDDEFEDRLLSSKPSIKIDGLIKEIRIPISPRVVADPASDRHKIRMRQIVIKAKLLGIPVKFQEIRDGKLSELWASPLMSSDKIPDFLKLKMTSEPAYPQSHKKSEFDRVRLYKMLLTTKLEREQLPPEAIKILDRNFRSRSDLLSIQTELHNASTDIRNRHPDSPIHQLKLEMSKRKLDGAEDIFNFIYEKYQRRYYNR